MSEQPNVEAVVEWFMERLPDVSHGGATGFEAPNPAKNNHRGENDRRCDGKVEWNILRGLVEMVHRVRDVDVCGEDSQVRGHKKLDPKLRVMRPSNARVSDDLL